MYIQGSNKMELTTYLIEKYSHNELADIKELKPKLEYIHELRMKERGL